jgi:hypothetical protein
MAIASFLDTEALGNTRLQTRARTIVQIYPQTDEHLGDHAMMDTVILKAQRTRYDAFPR